SPTSFFTLSLHDALPISLDFERQVLRGHIISLLLKLRTRRAGEPNPSSSPGFHRGLSARNRGNCKSRREYRAPARRWNKCGRSRSEEHTSELQSLAYLVC